MQLQFGGPGWNVPEPFREFPFELNFYDDRFIVRFALRTFTIKFSQKTNTFHSRVHIYNTLNF